MRAKRTSVSCVNSGENLRVWSASFEFEGLVLPKLPDGRVNEKVRQLLERKIAQAIASLDFDLGEPPPAPETYAHLIGCPECKSELAGGPIQGYHTCAGDIDPPDWVHAPNLPGVEVHPENVSDIDRMLAPKDKP